jgi:arylsulfatase
MIEHDKNVGQMLDLLDDLGIAEDTFVMYSMQIWAEPFTRLRVPKIFNLRTDPYEYADTTSNSYWDWVLHNIYFLYFAQAVAKKFAETFQEFPAIQKPNTFTINDALAKMSEAVGGSH